jgi:hypothetical protein
MARPAAAQEPSPAAAAPSYADVIAVEDTAQPAAPPINPAEWSGRTEYPLGQVIVESIFGKPDPDTWRPLTCSTLFSEGWLEPWVPSPNGSDGAPRQGWINAADGNFYRLWWFTFAEAFNQGNKSNAYLGAYTLYTSLSRRLLLITNIPFVERNSTVTGLPIAGGPPRSRQTTRNQTTFGDLTFTPRRFERSPDMAAGAGRVQVRAGRANRQADQLDGFAWQNATGPRARRHLEALLGPARVPFAQPCERGLVQGTRSCLRCARRRRLVFRLRARHVYSLSSCFRHPARGKKQPSLRALALPPA